MTYEKGSEGELHSNPIIPPPTRQPISVMVIPFEVDRFRFVKLGKWELDDVTKNRVLNLKSPYEVGWTKNTKYRYNSDKWLAYLKKAENYDGPSLSYGILTGYENLLVIDVDSERIQESLLKDHPDIFGKTLSVKTAGKGLLHFYFICDKEPKSFKCFDSDGKTLFDAQGIGKQVVGPGSRLQNGRSYDIVNNAAPMTLSYDMIRNLLMGYNENTFLRTEKYDSIEDVKRVTSEDPIINEIHSRINIRMLLSTMGISSSGDSMSCPFHPSVHGKCLHITGDIFYCFHCHIGGDVFVLWQEYHQCNFTTAKDQLMELAGIGKKDVNILKKVHEEKQVVKKIDMYKNTAPTSIVVVQNEKESKKIYQFESMNSIELELEDWYKPEVFAKMYELRTGKILPDITKECWKRLNQEWNDDLRKEDTSLSEESKWNVICESIISSLLNFVIVHEPVDSLNPQTILERVDDGDNYYVHNGHLTLLLKEFSVKDKSVSTVEVKRRLRIAGHVGNDLSRVIRCSGRTERFLPIKKVSLPDLVGGKHTVLNLGEVK